MKASRKPQPAGGTAAEFALLDDDSRSTEAAAAALSASPGAEHREVEVLRLLDEVQQINAARCKADQERAIAVAEKQLLEEQLRGATVELRLFAVRIERLQDEQRATTALLQATAAQLQDSLDKRQLLSAQLAAVGQQPEAMGRENDRLRSQTGQPTAVLVCATAEPNSPTSPTSPMSGLTAEQCANCCANCCTNCCTNCCANRQSAHRESQASAQDAGETETQERCAFEGDAGGDTADELSAGEQPLTLRLLL